MGFFDFVEDVAKGAAAGVALVAALPVCGAVGTVTACGAVVGSVVGAAAMVADHLSEEDEDG